MSPGPVIWVELLGSCGGDAVLILLSSRRRLGTVSLVFAMLNLGLDVKEYVGGPLLALRAKLLTAV